MADEGIAAGVGAGLDMQERFRPVAAWAWIWRSFDMALPDVAGAGWQADPAAEAGETGAYPAEGTRA